MSWFSRPHADTAAWDVVELPLPAGAGKPYLDIARCSPAGDVWLIMTVYSRAAGEQRAVFRETGTGFERLEGVPGGLVSASVLSPTDVWFAGRNGRIAHFDGTTWTTHVFEGFWYDFLDVHAFDGSDVWLAAAGARVVHFDGTQFTIDAAPVFLGSSTHELWGTADELFVPVNAEHQLTSVARHASNTWRRDELGEGGATLVRGSGPRDVWVLSRRCGGWHFDGTSWRRHAMTPGPFWSLHVSAPDRAFAVGDAGMLATWDGAQWTTEQTGAERLTCVARQRDGHLLVGGERLYRSKRPR